MQRRFIRSPAPIRVIVAGRQAGKTHAAAEEVVRLILARPGSESCLLMPTYKSTKAALRHLRRAVAPLGGRVRWKEVDKSFGFPNGALLYVRTAEDKEGVPTRGLTLDGVLWVDEAGYVPRAAWDAARLTQAAVQDPRVIVTGTPCGRNWLYEEWLAGNPGPKRSPLNESFRFRSVDSPYCNAEFVADLKKKLGAKSAMQELNAQFLGDAGAAFNHEDIEALFATDRLAVRGKQLSLGVDLAKEKDWTVCTLMNELGEAWILGRWRHRTWPETEKRITDFAQDADALVVVDHGHGGGYGGCMADYLEKSLGAARVHRVRTGNIGVKAQICEALVRDVENRRLLVERGEYAEHLRHELAFFESHREVVAGVERIRYHGPRGDGEDDHDDCVISLALANWGRIHGWDGPQGETEDLQEYVDALDVLTEPSAPLPWQFRPPESGWMFPSSGHWQWPSGPGYEL
jgi:hypothetical protein